MFAFINSSIHEVQEICRKSIVSRFGEDNFFGFNVFPDNITIHDIVTSPLVKGEVPDVITSCFYSGRPRIDYCLDYCMVFMSNIERSKPNKDDWDFEDVDNHLRIIRVIESEVKPWIRESDDDDNVYIEREINKLKEHGIRFLDIDSMASLMEQDLLIEPGITRTNSGLSGDKSPGISILNYKKSS